MVCRHAGSPFSLFDGEHSAAEEVRSIARKGDLSLRIPQAPSPHGQLTSTASGVTFGIFQAAVGAHGFDQ
jgi:hypothetical protein